MVYFEKQKRKQVRKQKRKQVRKQVRMQVQMISKSIFALFVGNCAYFSLSFVLKSMQIYDTIYKIQLSHRDCEILVKKDKNGKSTSFMILSENTLPFLNTHPFLNPLLNVKKISTWYLLPSFYSNLTLITLKSGKVVKYENI